MLRLGKGKALGELAAIVRENIGGNEGEKPLYIFGLADHDRHSHLYLGELPNGVRIKQYIDTKGICRVNLGLPVTVPYPSAVGIVASMRTEETLPVTANLVTFIYQAVNGRVEFPRDPVIVYRRRVGDIFETEVDREYVHIALGEKIRGNVTTFMYRRARRGTNGWEAYGPERQATFPWLDIPMIRVGDFVRPRVDLIGPRNLTPIRVEDFGKVITADALNDRFTVMFNGVTGEYFWHQLAAIQTPV